MRRVSASKAALLGACAYSFRPTTPLVESKGKAAEMGDAFHKAMVPIVETLRGEIPERATKWMQRRMVQATAWVAKNHVSGWRAEVAYAYKPATGEGRILGYDIGREYEKHGLLADEVAGSADIAVMSGETVRVWDFKTGRTIGAGAEAQLEWLALFAARAHQAWSAEVTALHVTETGVHETQWFYDDVQLWRIAEQLRIDVEAIDDAWPVTGAHCDNLYCSARDNCEPYQSLVQLHRKEAS